MKKHDLIIICIALLIFTSLIIIYLCFNNSKQEIIEICYKNQVIYKFNYDEDIIIDIDGKENKIVINDEKVIDYNFNKDFTNKIEMKDKVIKMTDASCENKYCMAMRLNNTLKTPIICTNGIIVRFSSEEVKIYV